MKRCRGDFLTSVISLASLVFRRQERIFYFLITPLPLLFKIHPLFSKCRSFPGLSINRKTARQIPQPCLSQRASPAFLAAKIFDIIRTIAAGLFVASQHCRAFYPHDFQPRPTAVAAIFPRTVLLPHMQIRSRPAPPKLGHPVHIAAFSLHPLRVSSLKSIAAPCSTDIPAAHHLRPNVIAFLTSSDDCPNPLTTWILLSQSSLLPL